VSHRGYAEAYSRAKPHLNIGTIGELQPPYSTPIGVKEMDQAMLIMERQR